MLASDSEPWMLQVKPEDRGSRAKKKKKNQNGAHIKHDCNCYTKAQKY